MRRVAVVIKRRGESEHRKITLQGYPRSPSAPTTHVGRPHSVDAVIANLRRNHMNPELWLSRRTRGFLVVAAIAGAITAIPMGDAQASANRTITVFEASKGSTFGFVDNAPKTNRKDAHASIGDILAFSSPIFDASRTHRLGLSSGECIATRPGRIARATFSCSGTFALNDGTLVVAALQVGEPKTLRLAVTGGTGAYDGARGTVIARTLKDGTEDTIALLP
jgi:hypothetical protein